MLGAGQQPRYSLMLNAGQIIIDFFLYILQYIQMFGHCINLLKETRVCNGILIKYIYHTSIILPFIIDRRSLLHKYIKIFTKEKHCDMFADRSIIYEKREDEYIQYLDFIKSFLMWVMSRGMTLKEQDLKNLRSIHDKKIKLLISKCIQI